MSVKKKMAKRAVRWIYYGLALLLVAYVVALLVFHGDEPANSEHLPSLTEWLLMVPAAAGVIGGVALIIIGIAWAFDD